MKIAYPDGPEFDILALFADGSGEPDDWWGFWFQSGLDGVMKFTPARTRKSLASSLSQASCRLRLRWRS